MFVTYKLRLFASSKMFSIRLLAAAGSADRIDHFARYVNGSFFNRKLYCIAPVTQEGIRE